MAAQATFTTLPPELREQVYEYIALGHTTRRVHTTHRVGDVDSESVIVEHKTTTSTITATCRLIHSEFEDVARKATTAVEFTAANLEFNHIIDYFDRYVDSEYLATLQQNEGTIHVNMVVHNSSFAIDMPEFYTWALFLINTKLEVAYHGESATWMAYHLAIPDPSLPDRCVIEENSPQTVRDNIEEIRNKAKVFEKAIWMAYPYFFEALQEKYNQDFNRSRGLPPSTGKRLRNKPAHVGGVPVRYTWS